MHGIIFERDHDSSDSSASRDPVARLQGIDHSLPSLGLALLKIKRGKDKKQGKQQEKTEPAARGARLHQQKTHYITHHAKIAFTAAHTLASLEWESLTLICDR